MEVLTIFCIWCHVLQNASPQFWAFLCPGGGPAVEEDGAQLVPESSGLSSSSILSSKEKCGLEGDELGVLTRKSTHCLLSVGNVKACTLDLLVVNQVGT
jgi:hypothetical protein